MSKKTSWFDDTVMQRGGAVKGYQNGGRVGETAFQRRQREQAERQAAAARRVQQQMEAQHPSKFGIFSNYKTPVPISETEVEVSPFAVLPRDRRFDMNRLENAKIVSLYGDRLRAGDTIISVNGLPVNVRTHGGPFFGALQEALGGNAGWASEYGALAPSAARSLRGWRLVSPSLARTRLWGPERLIRRSR